MADHLGTGGCYSTLPVIVSYVLAAKSTGRRMIYGNGARLVVKYPSSESSEVGNPENNYCRTSSDANPIRAGAELCTAAECGTLSRFEPTPIPGTLLRDVP